MGIDDQHTRRRRHDREVHDQPRRQGLHRGRPRGRARLRRDRDGRGGERVARLLQGSREVGAHVPGDRRRALLVPGRLGQGRGRRHARCCSAAARSASTPAARRSSPRRSRRRSRRTRRGRLPRRRRARRAVRRANRRGRRRCSRARRPTRPTIIEGAAEHVAAYKPPKQVVIVDHVPRAAERQGRLPMGARGRGRFIGSGLVTATTLPPPRRIDELDAADRDLEEIGVAVITDVLDATATADVRARLLDAADRSEAAGIPTRGYAFDFDGKNRRVFMLFAWDPVFVELIQHPLAVRYVQNNDRGLSDLELQRQRHRARGGWHASARRPVLRAATLDRTVRRERGVAARRLHGRERGDAGDPAQPSRVCPTSARRLRRCRSRDPPAASW